MNTLDPVSKRILVTAVSISLVILSLSAFVLSINRATALAPDSQQTDSQPALIGLGADDGWVYYARFDRASSGYIMRRIGGGEARDGDYRLR